MNLKMSNQLTFVHLICENKSRRALLEGEDYDVR